MRKISLINLFNVATLTLLFHMTTQATPLVASKYKSGTCQQGARLGNYNVSLLTNLSFHSPDHVQISKYLKSTLTYPQGFFVDEDSGRLFVLRYSNTRPAKAIIEVYGWPDFNYKKMFYLEGTHGTVSEGLVVLIEQGVEYLFVRGGEGLIRYPVAASQEDGDKLYGQKTGITNLAQSFSYYENKWYLEQARSRRMHLGSTRGDYTVYDDRFLKVGSITFDPLIAGFKESQSLKAQKHQGFVRYKDGFAMSFGGFWKYGAGINPYHRQGIELFDTAGKCTESYVIDPQELVVALRRKGVIADRIENEGIQVLRNGDFVLMNIAQITREQVGGLLFLKLSRAGEGVKDHLQLNNLEN